MIKVILFGTGSSCEKINRIIDYRFVEIIAYADNNKEKVGGKLNNISIISPEHISKLDYDFIIIASIYFDSIKTQLLNMGISNYKILEFYKFHNINMFVSKLREIENFNFDTILTGMSYAKYGIDIDALNRKTLNIALNSQDIYFDYLIMKYLLKNYPGKQIKYAIIGLAYFSFEFDLLKSSEKHLASRYLPLKEEIKINREKFGEFSRIIKEINNDGFFDKYSFLSKLSNELFVFNYSNLIEKFESENENNKMNIKDKREKLAKRHSNKNYSNTVSENKMILENLLELLASKSISPIVVVHPQHISYRKYFSKQMIDQFEIIISELQQHYNFRYVNLFDSMEFDEEDFFDVHHLNKKGAGKVSCILNENLNR